MPSAAGVVRAIDGLAAAVSIAGRTVLGLDTNQIPADWSHITKIDPEPTKQLPLAYPLYLQHTSAVSVGGSSDVTGTTTEETFELINAAGATAFHEPSAARHVTDRTREQSAFLAIPEVLNGDGEALVGILGEGIEYAKEELAPAVLDDILPFPIGGRFRGKLSNFAASWLLREAVFEAYIIMNLDSAAAREANVTEADLLSPPEAKQRALAAEHHLESEVIYLEYSGTFGGEEAAKILEAIDNATTWPRLWYGGGLAARQDAETVLEAGADAVVVGNVFHEIAPEEAELFQAARKEFEGDVEHSDLEDWIENETEPTNTYAAKFLSTVTSVPDPERHATQYLAAGVKFGLELDTMAASLGEPSATELRGAFRDGRIPGQTTFDTPGGSTQSQTLARRLGESLLAEKFGVETSDGFESRHLAITL
ncbi:MAG: geranylgeranylglyceryl/heptaprenylglyceryl phosphate synthase [Salinirussus sp.]